MIPVMFEMNKEGIIEMMEKSFLVHRVEIFVGQYGAPTLTFKDLCGCVHKEFFGAKDRISARRWIMDMDCAQLTSFCYEGSKVMFDAGCLRERVEDWWEEVGYSLGEPYIKAMIWPNFVTRFRAEFAPAVEV